MSLSAIATLFVHRWELSQQQNRFQQQIENLAIALQRSLNRYTDVLVFLGDHYGVSQGQVERQDFEQFVLRSLNTYPGIQALEWAPLVPQSERSAFEQTIQTEGFPKFQITELTDDDRLVPAGERPTYIPVTYVAPLDGNEAALGFDLNSSSARVAAIEPARDSGSVQATGRIRLVQEQRNQYGFLVVLPLYQTADIPADQATRQAQFEGVLLGVFRVSDVVEEALQDLSVEIDFVLSDQNATADQQFLGRYDAERQAVMAVEEDTSGKNVRSQFFCRRPIACTRTLEIGQRQWLVQFAPAANYPLTASYGTWITLLTGLLLTGSLALFLQNLQNELLRTQALNDLKQRFFSMASHELRTPLSTILLSAELLQVNDGQPDQLSDTQTRTNIQRIHLTAQQMSQQITDLLTLTRAEAGKLEFNPELLDISVYCQQVLDHVQAGIKQPIIFSHPNQPIKAFWDKKLVRSLLGNLLSNAAKYSPDDTSIQVNLSSNGQVAMLTICDRGIGIPAADLPHIQAAFQRASNVGDIAGTGLGLAIVDACVALHSGNWHIDSTEEKGTTVTVNLPLE